MLDRLAMVAGNIIVAPHRLELGTEAAELVDEWLNLGCGSGAGGVHPERAQHEARHTLPVVLRSPSARVEENEAQDVALFRRQRSVVYEHHSRSPVPGDDVVFRISDKRRTRVQRVQHALQAWRGAVVVAVARFGRTAEAKQEKMLALDLVSMRAREIRLSTSAEGAPPRPCSSHVYQVGLMLARCATSSRRSPGVRRRRGAKPNAAGSSFARRCLRKSPSRVSVAMFWPSLLRAIPR